MTTLRRTFEANPDFSFIKDDMTRNCIEDGYKTIMRLNVWDILIRKSVNENTGFMFNKDPVYDHIMNEINNDCRSGHSGFTMAFTMRNLDFIAKNGLDKWKENYLNNN